MDQGSLRSKEGDNWVKFSLTVNILWQQSPGWADRFVPAQGKRCLELVLPCTLRECLWNWIEMYMSVVWGLGKDQCLSPKQRRVLNSTTYNSIAWKNHISGGSPSWPDQQHTWNPGWVQGQEMGRDAPSPAFSANFSGTTEGAALVWVPTRQSFGTVGLHRGRNRTSNTQGTSPSSSV